MITHLNLSKYNRWQAFASHLALSLLIFLALLSLIVFVWFPGDLIHAGGWNGIKIVAGIDLALGPLLTLIVFNPKKKSLPFDLAVIGTIQFLALGYGVWIINNERPHTVVLSHEGLHIISRADSIEPLGSRLFSPPHARFMDVPPSLDTAQDIASKSELISLEPFVSRVDLYMEYPMDVTTSPYKHIHEFDDVNSCFISRIISTHLNGSACVAITDGSIKLFRTE